MQGRSQAGCDAEGTLTGANAVPNFLGMGGVRRHKRSLAWLAIVALVSNVLVGGYCRAPAKAAQLMDELLGPLIICTASGTVTPHDSGGSNPDSSADHCKACRLIAGFALLATTIVAGLALPAPFALRPMPVRAHRPARHLNLGGIGSRAPPLSA
jgi:hypothetical protein